ncbi:50S ribosomal protein L4 [Candidatus Bathyarchaeota archaeon]|nr:50S ribosomal protein L4 [Candidatus Bathyarchaeota archaeon]
MKVPVYNLKGEETEKFKLPKQFETPVREDLIRKAVTAAQKNRVQPYGSKTGAGRLSSAKFRGTRRGYGHSYNWSVARLPRLLLRGGRRVGRVVSVPQAVGGPAAHPPKAEREWDHKMNDKERRLAIRAALAAAVNKEMVVLRGHKAPKAYPFVVVEAFEGISKTKDIVAAFESLGLSQELERASKKKLRAGRGKSRGRTYKRVKGPLLVIGEPSPVVKAASNIPGVDVVTVNQLNAELLAPGAHPGRLTIFTKKALEKMDKDKLFL